MSYIASAMNSASYATNTSDDRDNSNGFEFTRRKRWPSLLLQELVGSALFCLKPIPDQRSSVDPNNGRPESTLGWKILFASPSAQEMLNQKPSELEGRDFFDLVFTPDHPQLQVLFLSLLNPGHPPLAHNSDSSASNSTDSSGGLGFGQPAIFSGPSGAGRTQTAYVRILAASEPSHPGTSSVATIGKGSSSSSSSSSGPVVWELRAHATGLDGPLFGGPAFGMAGQGTVEPQSQGNEGSLRGKAVWVMGRKVGQGQGEAESNGTSQSLDAFLELKLENERLREELQELQLDLDDDDYSRPVYVDPAPIPIYNPDDSDSVSDSSDSSTNGDAGTGTGGGGGGGTGGAGEGSSNSSPRAKPSNKLLKDPAQRKKKKTSMGMSRPSGQEGEGMHVCVSCGRTDSPEWRKGPLGPKTLCNACGLRWAKRNSVAPSKKDKKDKK
ncbi:hypothetical protein BCR39DRAFT_515313 [Naematelia encephala]|uniref:GATA-type domain-containing protein n=1 Tax=Naematelia encephala TaxID=71784 RepID=A0A1Y2BJD2_9TREE|nr:hypothetical protein BCR39DRAFT_515313 [Naematelia encephala]